MHIYRMHTHTGVLCTQRHNSLHPHPGVLSTVTYMASRSQDTNGVWYKIWLVGDRCVLTLPSVRVRWEAQRLSHWGHGMNGLPMGTQRLRVTASLLRGSEESGLLQMRTLL